MEKLTVKIDGFHFLYTFHNLIRHCSVIQYLKKAKKTGFQVVAICVLKGTKS